jgi:diacylglycerol kinase family enzyme
VARLEQLLVREGFHVDVTPDIERISREAAAARAAGELRVVVAAGGDGTVGLVANRTPPGTPIAILPLGTENLLARHLGFTADPSRICAGIRRGATLQIDAGKAGDRLFLLMVSCGFDADVVRRLHSRRKGHIHHLMYAKPIWDSVRNYQYPLQRVYFESPGLPHDSDRSSQATSPSEGVAVRWVFVANLPRYALGLPIVPDALGDDGLLDVCAFRKGGLWSGLRYLAGVLLGRHRSFRDCVAFRASRLRIESEESVPYQLDGDPGGYLPVELDVLPKRVTLMTPSSSRAGK